MPGNGSFPWESFMPALERAGYVGPIMLEFYDRGWQDGLASLLSEARATVDTLAQFARAPES